MSEKVIRMGSGRQLAPQSTGSAPLEISREPSTKADFANALTPCLALVGGVGMTTDARKEWLAAAYRVIGHIPADILRHGATKAMELADHPSKIVPIIARETKDWMATRFDTFKPTIVPALPAPERGDYCTPDQAREILEEFGLASKFASAR